MIASIEIWNEGFNLFEVDSGEYTAKSDSIGTISEFTHRGNVLITTNGTSIPANYQVKVTIAYEAEMQSLFQDIRFNTQAGEYIDYYIESYIESNTADVWLELPDAIIDPGDDTICIYYGNDGLTDGGVGADTFDFFDDFNGDLSKWTKTEIGTGTITQSGGDVIAYSGGSGNRAYIDSNTNIDPGLIIEGRAKLPVTAAYCEFGLGQRYGSADDNVINFMDPTTTNSNWYLGSKKESVAGTQTQVAGDASYHDFKIIWESNQIRWYIDDVIKKTESDTTYIPTVSIPFSFGSQYSNAVGYAYLSEILTRKYITNEPITIFEISNVVTAHTGTTVDVTGTPFTIDKYVGYSIKFTDGTLNTNGYVITSNDTNTITCSAADFSTLSDGENFKIITTGKDLSSIGSPVTETTISSEVVQTLTQSYDYGFDDLFTLDDTDSPVTETTIATEELQTLTQSYNYGFDDLFTLDDTDSPVTETTISSEVVQTLVQSYNYGFDDLFTLKLTCIISGNVKDNVGHNLPDVNITFENDVSYDTTTDSDGNYSQTVDADVYDVTASVLGSGLVSETESVDANNLFKTQDFVLDRTTAQDKGVLLTDRNLLQKDN